MQGGTGTFIMPLSRIPWDLLSALRLESLIWGRVRGMGAVLFD